MSNETTEIFKPAIAKLYEVLNEHQAKVIETQKAINMMCSYAGDDIPFKDIDDNLAFSSSKISPDEFYGKSFTGSVRDFLNKKKKAASAEEILEALKKGGFMFPDSWKERDYLRHIATTLSKNKDDFAYIINGEFKAFGLWEFYPEKAKERKKVAKEGTAKDNKEAGTNEVNTDNDLEGEIGASTDDQSLTETNILNKEKGIGESASQ